MNGTTLATTTQPLDPSVVAQVLLSGDLEKLTDPQRMAYCTRVCESLGLNPLTQPFAFIRLNGKLVMYAKKDATEQLRKLHTISIDITAREVIEGVFMVTAQASMPSGRRDESIGAVPIENVKGEARANAVMKAETKAKRRVTLSICGLGMLDETEVEQFQPPYVVEPPAPVATSVPEGAVRVLKSVPQRNERVSWADVTYVDAKGEEHTLPTLATPKGEVAILAEQAAFNNVPVVLETKTGPRNGRTAIVGVKTWPLAPAPDDNTLIDIEIARKEAEKVTAL